MKITKLENRAHEGGWRVEVEIGGQTRPAWCPRDPVLDWLDLIINGRARTMNLSHLEWLDRGPPMSMDERTALVEAAANHESIQQLLNRV